MLSLTRKPGEAILIGDNVVVYIKEIKGKQVKLAIEAPRDVAISRAKDED
jgi:carbon storage regulator